MCTEMHLSQNSSRESKHAKVYRKALSFNAHKIAILMVFFAFAEESAAGSANIRVICKSIITSSVNSETAGIVTMKIGD